MRADITKMLAVQNISDKFEILYKTLICWINLLALLIDNHRFDDFRLSTKLDATSKQEFIENVKDLLNEIQAYCFLSKEKNFSFLYQKCFDHLQKLYQSSNNIDANNEDVRFKTVSFEKKTQIFNDVSKQLQSSLQSTYDDTLDNIYCKIIQFVKTELDFIFQDNIIIYLDQIENVLYFEWESDFVDLEDRYLQIYPDEKISQDGPMRKKRCIVDNSVETKADKTDGNDNNVKKIDGRETDKTDGKDNNVKKIDGGETDKTDGNDNNVKKIDGGENKVDEIKQVACTNNFINTIDDEEDVSIDIDQIKNDLERLDDDDDDEEDVIDIFNHITSTISNNQTTK